MKVWVLRHGEAANQARTDAERPLTGTGKREATTSARHLLGQPLDAIVASPYVRAQQTATLVHEALRFEGKVITAPWLTPESDPLAVTQHLEQLDLEHVLLVSHQPLVGNLISLLEHGNLRHPEPMRTASLAELEGDRPRAGSMALKTVHHP